MPVATEAAPVTGVAPLENSNTSHEVTTLDVEPLRLDVTVVAFVSVTSARQLLMKPLMAFDVFRRNVIPAFDVSTELIVEVLLFVAASVVVFL